MAEYVLGPDEDQEQVARELLANADHPDDVQWRPRSNTPRGGVYEIPDELSEKLLEHRRAVRDAEAKRIEDAQAAADERDSADGVAEGLLTPAEAGFHANVGSDPGASTGHDDGGASQRDLDAHTLSDEEWAAKYPDEERPDLETDELPEGDEPAESTDPADEQPTAEKPAARKRARRNATTKEAAADPAAEETK